MRFIKLINLLSLFVLISSCTGGNSNSNVTNGTVSINTTSNIKLSTYKQRQYTAWKINGNIKTDITADTIWSSSNSDVATIDKSGLLVTHAPGDAVILAKYKDNLVSSTVTVSSDFHKIGQNWPNYLAMGTISANETSGNDAEPTNVRVDAVFTYNGAGGDGDPGKIETPYKIFDMFDMASAIEKNVPDAIVNPVLVEYQWDLSGGWNTQDVVDQSHLTKHLFNLMFLANVLENNASGLTKTNGTILLNPDLLGYIANTNRQQTVQGLDIHVESSLNSAYCMMTQSFDFGQSGCSYKNKPITVTGNVNDLLISLLQASKGNTYAASQSWAACVESIVYPACKSTSGSSNVPTLSNNFNGWVQAQNWSIKKFGADVSFGWHEDLSATPNGNWWVHGDSESANQYANIVLGEMSLFDVYAGAYQPDFIYFDRYGADDYNSSVPSLTNAEGIFYNDAAWTNILTMAKSVSESLLSIQGTPYVPVMLWQIPAAHIPASNESSTNPLTEGSAPDYFFGDLNLLSDLSNIAPWVESSVGTLMSPNGSGGYGQCQGLGAIQCLTRNGFNWAHQDNVELEAATNAHVFAILWGAGGATGVWVVPGVTLNDNQWMINTINNYYANNLTRK